MLPLEIDDVVVSAPEAIVAVPSVSLIKSVRDPAESDAVPSVNVAPAKSCEAVDSKPVSVPARNDAVPSLTVNA